MTVGPMTAGSGSARTDLGASARSRDATEIPAVAARRAPTYPASAAWSLNGEAITAAELEAIESEQGVAAAAGDVALVRTGYLAHWPDPDRLAAHRGAGPDLSAAKLLAARGVIATGSDTETYEVQPAPEAASRRIPSRSTRC